MGKLHKLRKDIEQNPQRWMARNHVWWMEDNRALAAELRNNQWQPIRYSFKRSYRHFVRSVLESLGYKVG